MADLQLPSCPGSNNTIYHSTGLRSYYVYCDVRFGVSAELRDTNNGTFVQCFDACDTYVATQANANGAACVATSWYQTAGDIGYCKLLYSIDRPDLVGYQGSRNFRWTEYDFGAAAVYPQLPASASSSAGTGGGAAGTGIPTMSRSTSVSGISTEPTSTSTSTSPNTIISERPPGSELHRSGLGVGLGVGIPGIILLAGLAAFIWKWKGGRVGRRAEFHKDPAFEEDSHKQHFHSQTPTGPDSENFASRIYPFICCGRRQEKTSAVAELRDQNSIHELGGHSPRELGVHSPRELDGESLAGELVSQKP